MSAVHGLPSEAVLSKGSIWVGDLPADVTESNLIRHFSAVCEACSSRVPPLQHLSIACSCALRKGTTLAASLWWQACVDFHRSVSVSC